MNRWRERAAGIGLCLGLAAVATAIGRLAPVVGAPVAAIVLGIIARMVLGDAPAVEPGVKWSARATLQAAIVVLGTAISLGQVAHVGAGTLPLIVVTMLLCLVAAAVVGRLLGVGANVRTLVGVGTAVCGASAIAAVAPVIAAGETEIALSLATVFFYNVVAVFVFPAIGHAWAFSQTAFGVWAGTAINDTSSVVAAAYAYGPAAGDEAVVVKLTRATTIVPIVVILALRRRAAGVAWWRSVPPFLPWFVVASALDTFGVFGPAAHAILTPAGVFLIAVALAAIGAQTDRARVLRAGWRPLALGLVLWVAVATSSLVMQRFSGAW